MGTIGSISSLTTAMMFIIVLLPAGLESAFADEPQATVEVPVSVLDRLQNLEKRVAELSNEQQDNWLNERRAEEVSALVHEVLADAQTRATLLSDEATAGYNNGFFIRSLDNAFYLKIRGFLQTRYVYNHRQTAPVGQDDNQGGFELARTRFGFMGHIIDPTWQYMIWAGYTSSGSTALYDAYIKKTLPLGFSVTAGQFKLPVWKEFLVSETTTQFVERSLLNYKASGSYTQGIMGNWTNDWLSLTASVNDGQGSINKPWNQDNSHIAATGRAEWKVFGDWKNYKDFESWQGTDPLLVLGGALHYEMGETGGGTQNPDSLTWVADAVWKWGGGNLYVGGVGEHSTGRNNADNEPGDYYGVVTQAGFFVTEDLELLARYEFGYSDLDDVDQLSVATAGFNYFLSRWSARFAFDVGYSFNAMPAFWANSAAGWLEDEEHGQIVVRAQVQLLF